VTQPLVRDVILAIPSLYINTPTPLTLLDMTPKNPQANAAGIKIAREITAAHPIGETTVNFWSSCSDDERRSCRLQV
jgi:hypothetical protein